MESPFKVLQLGPPLRNPQPSESTRHSTARTARASRRAFHPLRSAAAIAVLPPHPTAVQSISFSGKPIPRSLTSSTSALSFRLSPFSSPRRHDRENEDHQRTFVFFPSLFIFFFPFNLLIQRYPFPPFLSFLIPAPGGLLRSTLPFPHLCPVIPAFFPDSLSHPSVPLLAPIAAACLYLSSPLLLLPLLSVYLLLAVSLLLVLVVDAAAAANPLIPCVLRCPSIDPFT